MPEADILFLHALTGLHPGSGAALGVVDLPVQRERHTQWPLIQGSSLKGVLRGACRDRAGSDEEFHAMFGPETANAADFAGALSFTDARLLAFPARSLKGVFAWTTCPAALARFARDARLLAGLDQAGRDQSIGALPELKRGEAICPSGSPLLVADDRIVLEEFEYQCKAKDNQAADWLARHAVADQATAERMRNSLVVLHDDDFTWFARHATEVVARVGLDYETKTVKTGALFYEEFVPPEAVFYSVVVASDSRSDQVDHNASGMLDLLRGAAPEVLQIGADETIGKGLCSTRFLTHGIAGSEEEA